MTELKPFQAIQYTTSSGENCVATKNNGIVTIQGDKNGVRQMKQDEFMKQFVEDQSKKTLERTPAKDTVSFSGAENPEMASNNKKGWLIALGTLALGAGIYALTRGKKGEDAVQKGAGELSETLNNSPIKNKASDVVNDIVEEVNPKFETPNAEIQKPVEIIKPEVVRPKATNPISLNNVNPAAIEDAVVIPIEKPAREVLSSVDDAVVIPVEKPAKDVLSSVDDAGVVDIGEIKQVDNIMDSLKETPIKNDTFIDDLNRMTDDLEKEAKKRREQERIDNDNMMMGAILMDDALRASQREIDGLADDISHNMGRFDDIDDMFSHNHYDDMNSSFNDIGSSFDDYGSSFDSFADDIMGGF